MVPLCDDTSATTVILCYFSPLQTSQPPPPFEQQQYISSPEEKLLCSAIGSNGWFRGSGSPDLDAGEFEGGKRPIVGGVGYRYDYDEEGMRPYYMTLR